METRNKTLQVADRPKNGLYQKLSTALVTTGVLALSATSAFADSPSAPDVTSVVTYIGYAVAAVVAIGGAKMIPAAAMWLYSSLTGMVKRG